jgi:Metallo-beta-lactamase superfamily
MQAGFLAVGGVVLLAVGFAVWWYVLDREEVPAATDYRIDLSELRRVAASLPGDLPLRVNHQHVATAALPLGAVFAGRSVFTSLPVDLGAFQVLYADGYLVIDSALDEEGLRSMGPGGTFDPAGYAAVSRALAGARQIVVTHEHVDHLGGIARAAESQPLAGRLQLTVEQLANDSGNRDAASCCSSGTWPGTSTR